ncbi:MAG: HAMP domain-containing sensor histidine kinase [Pirellulaceae bacterium]|nr:HAMP domain-containing sensor histidine kinase [Pirellulaceae bacterium]
MFERKSLKWPITLAVTMIVLLVCLAIGWVFLSFFGDNWTMLSIGAAMFAVVVAGVVFYLVLSIQQINLNRRQSNFIDSVTHELKSPIASLKLYIQTLGRRPVEEEQRQAFYQSMLEDVERLDTLISQLLDVARLSHRPDSKKMATTDIRIDELIRRIVPELCQRHSVDEACVQLKLEPILINALLVDLEIMFRNLLDNALKYAGIPPEVCITLQFLPDKNSVMAIISDNGPGIPRNMRRRVFGRFFRIGNELERKKPGTGLGLFLVRTVVRRLRGKIAIVEPPYHMGTRFEIRLPAAKLIA